MSDPDKDPITGSAPTQLEQLIERALEALDRGEAVDIDKLCEHHPDLRDAVAASLRRIADLPAIHREASGLDPTLGTVLCDRYRLDARVGQGAMGIVYRGADLQLGRAIAVKLLRPELVVGAKMDQRLAREGQVLASIRHRNVVTVHDSGQAGDGRTFLVMELLHGVGLSRLLQTDEEGQTPLTGAGRLAHFRGVLGEEAALADTDVRQVVLWLIDAAEGVQAAHDAGVVHRDVKPSNLYLERDGRVIVLDFGIVSSNSHATVGSDGSPLGTPVYMAPEQLDPEAEVDPRSDVYGLAATLYHLLTGRPPFRGSIQQVLAALARREPLRADRVRPGLPADLVAIVERGMAKDPALRYQTAAELRDDLRAWLEYRPVSARRAGWVGRAWRAARRSPAVRVVVAMTTVLVVGGAWWWIATALSERREARRAELWTHVPPALVNESVRFRPTDLMRSAAETRVLLDGLVDCSDDGVALALRALWRADLGDLAGAAEDAAAIVALGDAPYAAFAITEYRAGRVPDPSAAAQQAVAYGGVADRALAFLHAMRAGQPAERWDEQLLAVGAGQTLPQGLAEFDLLLRLRRALALEKFFDRMRACQAIEQDAVRLATLRGRPSAIGSLALANSLLVQARAVEARRVADAGCDLAPGDFSLRIVGGSAALSCGDPDAAIAQFRRAIELQRSSVHAREMLSDAFLALGDFDAADQVLTDTSTVIVDDGRFEKQHALVTFARAKLLLDAPDATTEQQAQGKALVKSADASLESASAKGVDTELERILCARYLGDRSACAPMFDWLAERPLDSEMILVISGLLPDSLSKDEVTALKNLLGNQATALGARAH